MARAVNAAGIHMALSPNVRGALWEKLILNCAYNAISAPGQLPLGELRRLGGAGVETAMRDIVAECIAVGRADGVAMPDDADAMVRSIVSTIPAGQYSSTAQDVARNRRSEIDHLNGHIVLSTSPGRHPGKRHTSSARKRSSTYMLARADSGLRRGYAAPSKKRCSD